MTVDYAPAREALVRSLRLDIHDERVLKAFGSVPRERFVPEQLRRYAYEDRALPIGREQTISQPLMVAIMTQALKLTGDEKVLEIGAGSGYQAAVLSKLAREVVSVERIPELAQAALRNLEETGATNVSVYEAGETLGRPEDAPFDAIIVTAGAPRVPRSLIDQLAMGGRLAVPVGDRTAQQLVRATKTDRGVSLEKLGECRFVPLIGGKDGWPEREGSTNGARPAR
jgi:protein-L-isoaspartate(D-aspartate) O-methyltransferase